jgi:hypothetical protein
MFIWPLLAISHPPENITLSRLTANINTRLGVFSIHDVLIDSCVFRFRTRSTYKASSMYLTAVFGAFNVLLGGKNVDIQCLQRVCIRLSHLETCNTCSGFIPNRIL